MNRIARKSALVTGASRGIGLAIARSLLENGANVFICATTSEGVDKAVAELEKVNAGYVEGSVCDVRNHAEVCALFADVQRRFGGLDILINNAGIGSFTFVEKMSPEEWKATIETNLDGVFYCCHEAIPLMRSRGGGYIINIGSLAGKNAFPGAAAYNASKFGLIGFSEALMQEVRYDHIRVSYIMPGSVNTDFGRSSAEDPSQTWKLLPEDVVAVVINLLQSEPRALASRVEIRPSEPKKS